jgi:hypothetical protein
MLLLTPHAIHIQAWSRDVAKVQVLEFESCTNFKPRCKHARTGMRRAQKLKA